MWKNRMLSKAWSKWWGEVLQTRKTKEMSELEKLRKMMARVALKKWLNAAISRSWNKWHDELRRKRLLIKVAKRWAQRTLSKGWRAWEVMMMEKKRLRHLTNRALSLWKNRALAMAMSKWWAEVLRTWKAAKAARLWMNRAMAKACNAWLMFAEERKRLRVIASKVVGHWMHRYVASLGFRGLVVIFSSDPTRCAVSVHISNSTLATAH